MFSCVELLIARTLTTTDAKPIAATMTRTVSAAGMDWGLLAAAGVVDADPGRLVIWFVRNYIRQGLCPGPGVRRNRHGFLMDGWTLPTALFFCVIALLLAAWRLGNTPRGRQSARRHPGFQTTRGDRLFVSLLGSAYIHLALAGSDRTQPVVGSALSIVYARRRISVCLEGKLSERPLPAAAPGRT